jgi:alpha-beta hydrolase superfamily lysophospholipase
MGTKSKAGRRHRLAWRLGLAALPTLGLGLLGVSWLIAYLVLHPPTLTEGESPSDPPALTYQEVSFTTSEGLLLRGWQLPGQGDATVILVHGFARDRSELLPEARWLVERGYSVLLFDSRGQGSSAGSHITLGYREARDVRAAVDFILSQKPKERVAVMGYSMGGVAAIQAAADDGRIRAVLAVSPFATLRETINHRLGPARPLARLIVWWGERMTGLDVDALRPVDVVSALSPRPILIMQAGDDRMVPPDSGQWLFESAGTPKELWSVPGVAHVDFRQALPEAYKWRVIRFFEHYLPLDD